MRLTLSCKLSALIALVAIVGTADAAIIINDFSGGVTAANHPAGAGVAGTWYDATYQTFGTPSANTLSGSAAMRIDDGGFENGVYAIYQSIVPVTGTYTVSADMLFNDTAASDVVSYQLGVIVNGSHRGSGNTYLAAVSGPGTAVGNYTGLTKDVLDATTIQNVVTGQFTANAGDSLLIAFADNVTSGAYSAAAAWSSASVLVDNLMLNVVIPEPATLSLAGFGLLGLLAARRKSL